MANWGNRPNVDNWRSASAIINLSLEEENGDISVTKFMDQRANDTTVTKFLNQRSNDTTVTKFLDSTAEDGIAVTKYLHDAFNDISVTKFVEAEEDGYITPASKLKLNPEDKADFDMGGTVFRLYGRTLVYIYH